MAAQSVNWDVPNNLPDARNRFCALGVRSHDQDLYDREPLTVIVTYLDADGRLHVSVHPELRNMYEGEDLEYIDALVLDFVERGATDPHQLINQISCLGGVGPLLLMHTGDARQEAEYLSFLNSSLVEL